MSKRKRFLPAVLLVAVLALVTWLAWSGARRGGGQLQSSVAAAAPVDVTGFARATGPRPFVFPADDGPHNDYQIEWWYYTGNLTASTGEHFGYQLTFFRRALAPPGQLTARPSDWGTGQMYMAHLALTDVSGGQHHKFERLERGAAGLAGAEPAPGSGRDARYRVWLADWSVASAPDGGLQVKAADAGVGLELDLRSLKPRVLQGDQGYSRKGPEAGDASYYYSLPRIATRGRVAAGGKTYDVEGLSWMDHEWSTSALSAGQVGWDWFSLQLSDGRELVLGQIRRADGSQDPVSAGTLVEADGTPRRLTAADFQVQVTGQWRSPHTGAVYPSGWKVSIPSAGLELAVAPYLKDQEMTGTYNYWEGASRAAGTANGRPVTGSGYVELTGYAGSIIGQYWP